MQTGQKEKIICPKCGHEQEIMVYPSINAGLDSDIADKLMRNQLFTFTCDKCGESTPLIFNCLYHDMERGLMVWLMPQSKSSAQEEQLNEMNETVQQMQMLGIIDSGQKYRYRVVRTVNELKEKILIAHENLDDRIIELLKVAYLVQVAENIGGKTVSEMMFDIIDDGYFFTIFYADEALEPAVIMLDMEAYRMMKEQYTDKIEETVKENEFTDISFEWARQVLFG